MVDRVILSAAPESTGPALDEVAQALPGSDNRSASDPSRALTYRELAPGVFLLALTESFAALAQVFRDHPPIFIRHMQPVRIEVPLAQEPADLEQLASA